MPRARLQPGEHSEIEAVPYRTVDGRKVRAANVRQAQTWRARCQFRQLDGTRKDVTRWAKTKRLAIQSVEAALLDLAAAAGGESFLKPSMPFVEAGRVWLDQIKRTDSGLSERTVHDYTKTWYRHVDCVGSPLRGLTLAQANDVQRLLSALQTIADSSGTGAAKITKSVLSGVLTMAVRRGVLTVNCTRSIGPVKCQQPRIDLRDRSRAFTPEERERVIAMADRLAARETASGDSSIDPRSLRKWGTVADVVAFMAGTGCRINEARMLLWSNVDLEAGTVIIDGTKSLAAVRRVNLPEWLWSRLRARRSAGSAQVYVFGSTLLSGEERPLDRSNLAGSIRQVLDEAGLEWAVPHTFRRSVATRLHTGGVPLSQIADQLGHADPSMTASVYLGRDFGGDKASLAALL